MVYLGGTAVAMLLSCCGGLIVVGMTHESPHRTVTTADDRRGGATPANGVEASMTPPQATATPTVAPAASPRPSAASVRTTTVTRTRTIPYLTRTVKDAGLAKGVRKVRTRGVLGIRTLTYEVTITDGVETGRRLLRDEVTSRPVARVVAIGTKTTAASCDRNYTGACVPVASDVDCAGGSGDGPAYVSGVVAVVGSDIYDLDRDDDGQGCD